MEQFHFCTEQFYSRIELFRFGIELFRSRMEQFDFRRELFGAKIEQFFFPMELFCFFIKLSSLRFEQFHSCEEQFHFCEERTVFSVKHVNELNIYIFFWKRAGTMGMTNYRMIGTQFALSYGAFPKKKTNGPMPCGIGFCRASVQFCGGPPQGND